MGSLRAHLRRLSVFGKLGGLLADLVDARSGYGGN